MAIELSSTTKEALRVTAEFDVDPTGNVVSFAFPAPGADPSSWTAGTWLTGWNQSTKKATAKSPTFGDSGAGATVSLTNGAYVCWMKVAGGSETPVRQVETINIT